MVSIDTLAIAMVNAFSWVVRGLLAVVFTLVNTFVATPLWLWRSVVSAPTKGSETPNALQHYLTRAAAAFLYWLTVFRAQPSLNTRTPSKLRDTLLGRWFTWIEPAPTKASTTENGQLNEKDLIFDESQLPVDLEPEEKQRKTGGLWFLNPEEKSDASFVRSGTARKSAVVLWFHGGAFVTLEAGDIFMGLTMSRLHAKYANVDVLSVNYRLAPSSKYPTQLFEAFSAWRHLRTLGYQTVYLGGDSAGANIACQLWHYLWRVHGDTSSIAGLLLISPWLDMQSHKRTSFQQRLKHCVVTQHFVETGFKSIQRGCIPDAGEPWISPLAWPDAAFAALPPTFVCNGGAEVLLEEDEEFVKRAQANGASSITHRVFDGHPHDFPAMFWFAGSAKRLFRETGQWIAHCRA